MTVRKGQNHVPADKGCICPCDWFVWWEKMWACLSCDWFVLREKNELGLSLSFLQTPLKGHQQQKKEWQFDWVVLWSNCNKWIYWEWSMMFDNTMNLNYLCLPLSFSLSHTLPLLMLYTIHFPFHPLYNRPHKLDKTWLCQHLMTQSSLSLSSPPQSSSHSSSSMDSK